VFVNYSALEYLSGAPLLVVGIRGAKLRFNVL
jgi:hypothetical protein